MLFTAVFAVVVTAAALLTVVVLRPRNPGGPPRAEGLPVSVGAGAGCGDGPCQALAIQNVNGQTVQLLANSRGDNGRFEAGGDVLEATVTALGARLDAKSLSCFPASVSACLILAPRDGGKIAQLLINRGGSWSSVDKPYFSDAGVIVLSNVTGGDAPEVVVVQASPVLAKVYALDGSVAGCTRRYSSLGGLRGWPDVRVTAADLRPCS